MAKIKVLMVCLGNICRSPLAEGILKTKVDPKNISVESAGTGDWHIGQLPDKRSIKVAKENDIDITDQRGRQFERSDFERFDLIYVMDNSNYEDVIAMARNDEDKKKVHLILNEIFSDENLDVPDPYTGGESGFERVFDMLDQATDKISEKLKQ
jgi:protein-tyrosine phosphatase